MSLIFKIKSRINYFQIY